MCERDEELERARKLVSSKHRPVERTTKLATNVSTNRVIRRTTTPASNSIRAMIPLGGGGGSSSFKKCIKYFFLIIRYFFS